MKLKVPKGSTPEAAQVPTAGKVEKGFPEKGKDKEVDKPLAIAQAKLDAVLSEPRMQEIVKGFDQRPGSQWDRLKRQLMMGFLDEVKDDEKKSQKKPEVNPDLETAKEGYK